MPEGVETTQIAANSDGDVLVVLDLHLDTSMIEQGFAREVVNRYQKLRKRAGLIVTDAVELYYALRDKAGDPMFEKALQSQKAYLKKALGSVLMPLSAKPHAAAVLFKEDQLIKAEDGDIAFTALIAPPTIAPDPAAFSDSYEEACVYLASRDRHNLMKEVNQAGKH